MYIEVDVYDNNDNYVFRRKIVNSSETFTLSGLQAETQYNVRARRNLNGLFSPYTISSFTTNPLVYDDFQNYSWTMWNGKTSMTGTGSSITSQEGNNYISDFLNSPTWSNDAKFTKGITFTTAGNNNLRRLEGNNLSSSGVNFKLAYACILKFNTIANNRNFAINFSYRKTAGITNGQFFFYISTDNTGKIKLNFQMIDNTTGLNPSVLELQHQTNITLNTVDYFGLGVVMDLQNSQFRFIVNGIATDSYTIRTSDASYYTSVATFKTAGGVAVNDNWSQTGRDSSVTGSFTDYTLFREVIKKDFSETAEQVKDIILNSFNLMGL